VRGLEEVVGKKLGWRKLWKEVVEGSCGGKKLGWRKLWGLKRWHSRSRRGRAR